MESTKAKIEVEVVSVTPLARNVKRFDLRRRDGAALPSAPAGAHIMLQMTEGLTRPYSLLVSGDQLAAYAIAVKLDLGGTGGSHFLHTHVAKGTVLLIDPPINTFAFCPDSCTNVFIAGGIGITPIMSMIQECERGSNPWKLYYAAKSRSDAAFASQFEDLHHVRLHFSNAQRTRLDIKEIVENAAMDAHLYCCGPTEMMKASAKPHLR
jgi:ferredoxin-NADP reductase